MGLGWGPPGQEVQTWHPNESVRTNEGHEMLAGALGRQVCPHKNDVGMEVQESACGGPQTQGYQELNAEECKTDP